MSDETERTDKAMQGDGRRTLNEPTRTYLRSLPAVSEVSGERIYYSLAFRREAMRRYAAGDSPVRIFREAGLDPKVIGYKRIERCFARWRALAKEESDDAAVAAAVAGRDEPDAQPQSQLASSNPASLDGPDVQTQPAAPHSAFPYGPDTQSQPVAPRPSFRDDTASIATKSDEPDPRDALIVQQALTIQRLERQLRAILNPAKASSEAAN